MAGENERSHETDPAPEFVGGEDARFVTDADLIAAGRPINPVPEGDEPVVITSNPDNPVLLGLEHLVGVKSEARWEPTPDSDGALTRENAVYQAIGAASVCWEDMSGTGVFQDDRANAVAKGLLAFLDEDDPRLPAGELETFIRIHDHGKRIREKIEAEGPYEGPNNPHNRWRQIDDGTWVSDVSSGPGVVVVVERPTPGDRPFIAIVGRMQEMNPGSARWLSLRLAEASVLAELGLLP